MQSGRQPWVQQKSQRYWKVDRNIQQCCATSRGFGWSQWQTVHSLDKPRPTIHQQSYWSVGQWRSRLKAVGLFKFTEGTVNSCLLDCLVVVCSCYLDIGITVHCCCVLPLWYNDVRVLWLCCNFFEHPVDVLIWFGLQYIWDIISIHMVCYL